MPPLLLAHASRQGSAGRELTRLLRSGDPGCQAVLRGLLRSPRTVAAYARDLRRLHGKACDLLDELDSTLALPIPGSRELIGV